MKAVLISIRPKWCELIASGEKTVEVRKRRPKLKTPFKCYIYETQGRTETPFVDEEGHHIFKGRGQVIGEFVCDRVIGTSCWRLRGETGWLAKRTEEEAALPHNACLTFAEIEKYAGGRNRGIYGWHISNLKIYDKPKELGEFLCKCNKKHCQGCEDFCDEGETSFRMCGGLKGVTRPPQSWAYCEECDR